ncbi:hypothetical protein KI387_027516, partial [Taxus chinensis]
MPMVAWIPNPHSYCYTVITMVRSIWQQSGEGIHSVDLRGSLSLLTQNIVCRIFSGRTFSDDELNGGITFKDMVSEMLAIAGAFCIVDYITFLGWLDLDGIRRRMQAARKTFDEFAEKVIDEHINRRRGKAQEEHRVKDMVDVLLDMAESESQRVEMKITRLHIKAIIMCDVNGISCQLTVNGRDILSVRIETSSITTEWALSELLRNPYVMVKVQQEIESVVGRNQFVKESDVIRCEYLQCIVKETLRLYPPAPLLLPHKSMGECNVDGYYIPPKTMLFVNVWAMGRDASIWEDPLQFNPERFIGKTMDLKGHDFELIPFGIGRRRCPEILMGLTIVELALTELIHCFDWNAKSEVNVDEFFGLTVPKKFPICARPSWRLSMNYNSVSNVSKDG